MKQAVLTYVTKPLSVKLDENPVELPAPFQDKVDNFWSAINKNNRFSRGEVFHVDTVKENQDFLNVILKRSDYAYYLYSVRNKQIKMERCRVIYSAGLVETADSYFVFGEMGKNTAYPGRLQCVGGGLSNQDLHDSRFDLEKSVLRELREELGIENKSDVKDCSVKYLKTGGDFDFITVLYHIQLNLALVQLDDQYEEYCEGLIAKGESPEFQRIVRVKNDINIIEEFIRNEKRDSVDYLFPFLKEMNKTMQ
jgi:8-oxo-dGTP pyrophosphatase MutT (NUDIX family)